VQAVAYLAAFGAGTVVSYQAKLTIGNWPAGLIYKLSAFCLGG
jgi:hypothetical protein